MFLNTSLASFLRQRCVTFQNSPRLPTQPPCQCGLPLLSWPSHRPISGLSWGFPSCHLLILSCAFPPGGDLANLFPSSGSSVALSWPFSSSECTLEAVFTASPPHCLLSSLPSLSLLISAIIIIMSLSLSELGVTSRCHFLSQVLYFVGFFSGIFKKHPM